MWYDQRVVFAPSVKHSIRSVECCLLLWRFWVTETTYPRSIFPFLAILERVFGGGGDIVDNVRAMGGMEHKATNDLSVFRSLWNLGGNNVVDVVRRYTLA